MKANFMKRIRNIETPYLKVCGNCLEFQNTTVQLSNISLLSTDVVAPEKFPILSVGLILLGICLLEVLTVLASILVIGGLIWLVYWYLSVEDVKDLKLLTVITNSGNVFPIVFKDKEFMAKVVTTITEIISHPDEENNITFNITECTFSNVIENLNE